MLPEDILVFTFTAAARNDLKERIGNERVDIATMHGTFLKLLKIVNSAKYHPSKLIDERAKDNKIRYMVFNRKIHNQLKRNNFTHKDITTFIGLCKNLYIKPIGKFRRLLYANTLDFLSSEEEAILIKRYEKIVKLTSIAMDDEGEINLIALGMLDAFYLEYENTKDGFDFDDIIVDIYEAMIANTNNILLYAQDQWKYILVDEFQDTNTLQFSIVKMIAEKHQNLYIIGDWKQAIYGWRGADYNLLKDINNHLRGVKASTLKTTYRNSKEVLKLANHVAVKLLGDEKIETAIDTKGNVFFEEYRSKYDEIKGTIDELLYYKDKDKSTFVLTRTNAYLTIIELFLLCEDIPYDIYGQSVLESPVIMDIALMLLLALSKDISDKALKRLYIFSAYYLPKRDKEEYLKSRAIEKLTVKGKGILSRTLDAVAKVKSEYYALKRQGSEELLSSTIKRALEVFEYDNYLKYNYSREELSTAREVMELFIETVDSFGTIENLLQILAKRRHTDSEAKIKLLTVHKAKGLEADNVYLLGLSDNIFPSSRAMSYEENLESEKRLLYVAITRARENLTVSYHKTPSEYYAFLKKYKGGK